MAFTKKNVMWYEVRRLDSSPIDTKRAKVHVPAGSQWFDGHFPDNPVLPGIAQLGMVYDIIAQDFDAPISVVDLSRVRFKQMILPDDELDVTVAPHSTKPGCFSFRMTRHDELVCNGMITVEVKK